MNKLNINELVILQSMDFILKEIESKFNIFSLLNVGDKYIENEAGKKFLFIDIYAHTYIYLHTHIHTRLEM